MKKIITYAIMLLVGIFAGATLIPALANSNLFTPTNNRLEMISEQQAMEIALNNSDESFEVVKIELEDLDDDDDEVEYEITLRNESKKVEVEINAYSGKINEWDEELLQSSSNNQTQMIGIEQAKRIALEKAGSSFEVTKAQLDDDYDDVEYDIKLISSEFEIEAEVDAYTGQIMKWEAKRVNKSSVTNTTPSTPTMITKERAIEIATKKAGSGFNVIEVELDDDDDDDDDIEYEIKLRSSTQEIEVEIDAYTGAITEWEVETFKSTTNNTTPSTPTMITKERAIEIARAKIGSNPVLEEIELDDDDGKMVYELEFEHGDVEYEFEIDAYTGQILEFEIDD